MDGIYIFDDLRVTRVVGCTVKRVPLSMGKIFKDSDYFCSYFPWLIFVPFFLLNETLTTKRLICRLSFCSSNTADVHLETNLRSLMQWSDIFFFLGKWAFFSFVQFSNFFFFDSIVINFKHALGSRNLVGPLVRLGPIVVDRFSLFLQ